MRTALPPTTARRGLGPLPDLVVRRAGEDALLRLLERYRLPGALLDDQDARLPLADMVGLFEDASRMLGDPALGLRVGAMMRPEDFGPWVGRALAAPTLRGALARLVEGAAGYQGAGSIQVTATRHLLELRYVQAVVAPERARQHADHVLPPMVAFVRRFLGDAWRPAHLLVSHEGRDNRALEEHFSCEVVPRCRGVGIALVRACLDTPRSGVADTQAEAASFEPRDSPCAIVRDIVALRLLDGAVDIQGAAARCGVSPRTLQRLLAAAGSDYRAIVEHERRRTACSVLAETPTRVGELAMMLGYAESAHFIRAFRRWTGVTPTAYRRALSPGR